MFWKMGALCSTLKRLQWGCTSCLTADTLTVHTVLLLALWTFQRDTFYNAKLHFQRNGKFVFLCVLYIYTYILSLPLSLTVWMVSGLPEVHAFPAVQDHLLHHTRGYTHLQCSPGQLDRKEDKLSCCRTLGRHKSPNTVCRELSPIRTA